MKRVIINNSTEMNIYGSFQDVLKMKAPEPTSGDRAMMLNNFNRAIRGEAHSGLGCAGVEELHKFIAEGWQYGCKKIAEFAKAVDIPALPSFRRTRTWGKMGISLSMSKAMVGSAKPWRSMTKTKIGTCKKTGGNISIVIDFNAHGGREAEQLFWRAVVGIRLAEALIKTGRRVRVIGMTKSTHNGCDNFLFAFVLKQYEEPLDINKIAIGCGLAGFFRIYEFASNCTPILFTTSGYGNVAMITLETDFGPLFDDSTPILIENIWSESTAVQTLTSIAGSIS